MADARANFEAVKDQIKGKIESALGIQNPTVSAPTDIPGAGEGSSPTDASAERATPEPEATPRPSDGESGDQGDRELKERTAKRFEKLLEEKKSSEKALRERDTELEKLRAKVAEAEAEKERERLANPDAWLSEVNLPKDFAEWDSVKQQFWISQQVTQRMAQTQSVPDDPEIRSLKNERRIMKELGDEDLNAAQLAAVLRQKEAYESLPAAECLVLARNLDPDLFAEAGGVAAEIPPSHQVQTPGRESRREVPKSAVSQAEKRVEDAIASGNRSSIEKANVDLIKAKLANIYSGMIPGPMGGNVPGR